MIWAPEDCHLIEFNEIATSDEWENEPFKVPARSMVFAGVQEEVVKCGLSKLVGKVGKVFMKEK
jgi:hypothetical protein